MTRRNIAIWVATLGLLVGCGTLEPIRIVITPTQSQDLPTVPTAAATEETTVEVVSANATQSPTEEPPIVITNTAEPTRTPIVGDGTFMGSILSPNYTITPPATNTPTEIPTLDPNNPLPTVTSVVAASGSLDPEEMGLHLYYNMGPDEFNNVLWQAEQTRVGWVKFQVDWSFFQPNNADEKSAAFQAFVLQAQTAKNFGFKVMLSVAKAPMWARSTNQEQDGPPDNPQDLINFLQLLFTDIKVENIAALEIWNEPNLIREWRGKYGFNGAGYMQLFVPVHDAMRSLFPSVHLLTGGLAPTGNSEASVDDRAFLQQMFDNGLGNYPDVSVGVHPYGWGNPPDAVCCDATAGQGWDDNPHFFFLDTLNTYREIMVENGFEGVQMWVTEFGWPTWAGYPTQGGEDWMNYTSPEQQAHYILRAFEIGQERIDIGPMILWNLNFANQTLIENRNEMAGFSILAPNLLGEGDPLIVRPIYTALRDRPQ